MLEGMGCLLVYRWNHSIDQQQIKQTVSMQQGVFSQGYVTSSGKVHQYSTQKKGDCEEKKLDSQTGPCGFCHRPSDQLCSLCMKVFYCCQEHLETGWHMDHKFNCEGRQELYRSHGIQERVNDVNSLVEEGTFRLRKGDNATQKKGGDNFMIYQKDNPNIPFRTQQSMNYSIGTAKTQSYGEKKIKEENALNYFIELMEQRRILRQKVMGQLEQLNERTPSLVLESIIKQAEQLLDISTEITKKKYKPSYASKISVSYNSMGIVSAYQTNNSSQHTASHGAEEDRCLAVTELGLNLEYLADNILVAKIYHNSGLKKQAREMTISLGRLLEQSEQEKLLLSSPEPDPRDNAEQRVQKLEILQVSKLNLLQSIIQMSQANNIDRTTQIMYKLFIKLISCYQGVWELIYAYFNMGTWYYKRTYYHKALKAYGYSVELLDSKQNNKENLLFKGDCYFNMGLAQKAQGDYIKGIEDMQEAYRIRANSIGKNSIEASHCLQKLAEMHKELEKWEECIEYALECHRIRKNHRETDEEVRSFNYIKNFMAKIYKELSSHKKGDANNFTSENTKKYYQSLIRKSDIESEDIERKREEEVKMFPDSTVTERCFKDDSELVLFKLTISDEMFETYNSSQMKCLTQLLDLDDKKMEKSKCQTLLLESDFVQSLSEEQRQEFLKINEIK